MPDDAKTADYCADGRLMSAIAAFEEADDAGQNPDPNEWLKRHPELAEYLSARARIRAIASPAPVNPTDPVPIVFDPPNLSDAVRAVNRIPNPTLVEKAPPLTLTVIDGPAKGLAFSFAGPGTFLVGRSSRAQFQFPSGPTGDLRISHTHLLVEVNLPRCRIHDLKSRNHTLVNDQKVASANLKPGDRIKIGRSVLSVDWSERASDPPGDEVADGEPPSFAPGPKAFSDAGVRRKSCPVCRKPRTGTGGPLCKSCRNQADGLPQLLPGFVQVRELGRGGMGIVSLALREADAKVVAVKAITPATVPQPKQVARFLREAEILKKLNHPHIVRFDQMGLANGLLYLVMEYVAGSDVEKVVKERGPLRLRPAVRLVCQLLAALEYAHARQFVHRDIKPANLLLKLSSQKKMVKVADFGLARVYQESQISGLTLQGDVGGTTAYMAPEQVLDYRRTQPAADQYSTAATLYFLLTGKWIYDLPKNVSAQLAMILHDDPIPILERLPDLPKGLAALIQCALSREPAERFPNVRAFRRALLPFAV